MSCVLLTGTIDPSVFLNSTVLLSDVKIRLSQYYGAIKWWIEKTNTKKIIFIENSGFTFDFVKCEELATKFGKQFEFLRGTPYVNETVKYGKSFGEVLLINEAIQKSCLLKDEDRFFKCTGRLKIKNINRILSQHYCSSNIFLGISNDKWVVTYFFGVDKLFYIQHLSDAYKYVNDFNGNYLERIYYSKLKNKKECVSGFKSYPNVDGISATINAKYHSGIVRLLIKNILLKLHRFDIK